MEHGIHTSCLKGEKELGGDELPGGWAPEWQVVSLSS